MIVAAGLGVAALALHTFRLGSAPVYLKYEEVYFALEARAIAATGHDTHGRLLPVYFQVFANSWYQPVLVYALAAVLKVLPLSEFAVRLPSAIAGAVDVVLMYGIGLRVFGRRSSAIGAALLLMLTPAHFIESRVAMDYLYPVPFAMAWLLLFVMFWQDRKPWQLFLATTCLGVGFFSYAAAIALMPLYLLLTLVAIGGADRDRLKSGVVAVGGFLAPLAIALPFLARHPEYLEAQINRYGPGSAGGLDVLQRVRELFSWVNVGAHVDQYVDFFSPGYLFMTGGANPVDSTGYAGVFLMPVVVCLAVGIYQAARQRSMVTRLLLAGFLTAPLAALAVPERRAVDRELVILPFGVLLAQIGLEALWSARYDHRLRRPVGIASIVVAAAAVAYAIRRLAAGSGFPRSVVPLCLALLVIWAAAAWAQETRRWRPIVAVLLAAAVGQFAWFWGDYFGDYRARTAGHFGRNVRGALEDVLAREPRGRVVPIYLTADAAHIDYYWRFYAAKADRPDLAEVPAYVDASKGFDLAGVPPHALIVLPSDGRVPPAGRSELRRIRTIVEPDGTPSFDVFERVPDGEAENASGRD